MDSILTKKIAIYVRVSSSMQVERGHSLEAQKQILINYCKEHNYEYEIFEDKGISAKNTNRKSLRLLLSRLKEFDIVLVWKLSRLTRSVADFSNLLEQFKNNNITFISYSEKFDTRGMMGKLLMYIIAIFAELERDILAENISTGKKQCFEEGMHTCSTVLGYNIKKKKLIVNENEAKIVRFIFQEYNKCKNYSKVARLCNSKGFRGKRGKNFHANSIRVIVHNNIYISYNTYLSNSKKSDHQAIISTRLFNKCQ